MGERAGDLLESEPDVQCDRCRIAALAKYHALSARAEKDLEAWIAGAAAEPAVHA